MPSQKTNFLFWLNGPALQHSARTAAAATVSVLAARLFKMPETYWAAVSTLVVMQSTLGASFNISVRRFIGTLLGAVMGALFATYFGPNVLAFGVGIFLTGVICALIGGAHRQLREHLDKTAYRYAGIAMAIIMLVVRSKAAWVVAIHRFIEVSVGIGVGLVITVLWPESQPSRTSSARQ